MMHVQFLHRDAWSKASLHRLYDIAVSASGAQGFPSYLSITSAAFRALPATSRKLNPLPTNLLSVPSPQVCVVRL
jgi:hypothetical protein